MQQDSGRSLPSKNVFDHLIFSEISSEMGGYWIEVFNPTNNPIDTRGYQICDIMGVPCWNPCSRLERTLIPPASYYVYCTGYTHVASMPECNDTESLGLWAFATNNFGFVLKDANQQNLSLVWEPGDKWYMSDTWQNLTWTRRDSFISTNGIATWQRRPRSPGTGNLRAGALPSGTREPPVLDGIVMPPPHDQSEMCPPEVIFTEPPTTAELPAEQGRTESPTVPDETEKESPTVSLYYVFPTFWAFMLFVLAHLRRHRQVNTTVNLDGSENRKKRPSRENVLHVLFQPHSVECEDTTTHETSDIQVLGDEEAASNPGVKAHNEDPTIEQNSDLSFAPRPSQSNEHSCIISQKVCPICLADFNGSSKLLSGTTCNHLFHFECLMGWMTTNQKKTCPTCRKLLYTDEEYNKAEEQVSSLHDQPETPFGIGT